MSMSDTFVNAESGIVDMGGYTSLHTACANGHLDIVNSLLDKGCNIDSTNDLDYKRPIHCATERRNNILIVKELVDRGCVLNVYDRAGDTPLDIAMRYFDKECISVLWNAMKLKNNQHRKHLKQATDQFLAVIMDTCPQEQRLIYQFKELVTNIFDKETFISNDDFLSVTQCTSEDNLEEAVESDAEVANNVQAGDMAVNPASSQMGPSCHSTDIDNSDQSMEEINGASQQPNTSQLGVTSRHVVMPNPQVNSQQHITPQCQIMSNQQGGTACQLTESNQGVTLRESGESLHESTSHSEFTSKRRNCPRKKSEKIDADFLSNDIFTDPEKKMAMIEKTLRDNMIEQEEIETYTEPRNANECVNACKEIMKAIKIHGKKKIQYYARLGHIFNKMKTYACRTYKEILKKRKFGYSPSMVDFFIRFAKLTSEYPDLLKCNVTIQFMMTHLKVIRQICESW